MITLVTKSAFNVLTLDDVMVFAEVSRRLSVRTQKDCVMLQSWCRARDRIDAAIMLACSDDCRYTPH